MLTRVFKSGNSLAVRIPKEMGFVDAAQDVEVERVGNTQVLGLLTTYIPVLPFDEAAAERFGGLRAAVHEHNRDTTDRLIAAHAVSLSLTLVTSNEADFKGYPGLVVEDWTLSVSGAPTNRR